MSKMEQMPESTVEIEKQEHLGEYPERIESIKLAREAVENLFSKRGLRPVDSSQKDFSFPILEEYEGGVFDLETKKINIGFFNDFNFRSYVHELLHAHTNQIPNPSSRVGKTGFHSVWGKEGEPVYFKSFNEALTEVLSDEAIESVSEEKRSELLVAFDHNAKEKQAKFLRDLQRTFFQRAQELIEERFELEMQMLSPDFDISDDERVRGLIEQTIILKHLAEFTLNMGRTQVEYHMKKVARYLHKIETYVDEQYYKTERLLLDAIVIKIADLKKEPTEKVLEEFKMAYLKGNVFSLRIIGNMLGKDILHEIALLSPQGFVATTEEDIEKSKKKFEKDPPEDSSEELLNELITVGAQFYAKERVYKNLIEKIEAIAAPQE